MTKDEVMRALLKLSAEDREAIRELLNLQAENDAGYKRLDEKLDRLSDR